MLVCVRGRAHAFVGSTQMLVCMTTMQSALFSSGGEHVSPFLKAAVSKQELLSEGGF